MSQIFTMATIGQVATGFVGSIGPATIIAFQGDMGAGKTTFISAVCKALGVTDAIGSPTYSIINQYRAADGKIIYHMDWYRLKDEDEAIAAGVEDPMYSGNLCLIEWPERAAALLPQDTLHVSIDILDGQTRKLRLDVKN